jgi:hypothetical protein
VNPAGHHSLPVPDSPKSKIGISPCESSRTAASRAHGRTPGLYKSANVVNFLLESRIVVDLPLHRLTGCESVRGSIRERKQTHSVERILLIGTAKDNDSGAHQARN